MLVKGNGMAETVHQARFGHATKLERFVLVKTFDTTEARRGDSGRGDEWRGSPD